MINRVKIRRTELDIGQEELAKLVGVTRQAIHSIEKGKYQPSVILAFKLASVLKLLPNDLFELERSDWL
ncbi:helix-turn-helix transcriptional regulator [Fulvivirga lutimaris]|uniref:helix-turn-helix transcriptional regulator n=1 Tax=Fulvivirga lutimaris TaxID=1819566 RepID=UPI0012BC1FF0|nr:helix-turn-helix transcriptional regulator [Fulvivirga lutimaris]MTI38613.1 transcriptional regulator [Fulvivirga lutimaris]